MRPRGSRARHARAPLSPLRASRRASPAPPLLGRSRSARPRTEQVWPMGQVRHAGRRDTTTAKHPAGRRGWASPAGSLCRNGSSAEGGADEPLTNVLLLEGQTGWRNALSACSAISRVLLVPRPERIRHRAPFGLRPSVPCGSRPSAVLGGDTDFERRATEAAAAVRGVAELEPPRLPARERPRLATVGATDGGKTTLSLEEVNVAIGGLPIWEAGHEFLSWEPRLRAATAHSPHVVTFGLVLPQLAALDTPRRAARRRTVGARTPRGSRAAVSKRSGGAW